MMTQDQAESTKEPINHGKIIKQFLLDIVKSMQQLERYIWLLTV